MTLCGWCLRIFLQNVRWVLGTNVHCIRGTDICTESQLICFKNAVMNGGSLKIKNLTYIEESEDWVEFHDCVELVVKRMCWNPEPKLSWNIWSPWMAICWLPTAGVCSAIRAFLTTLPGCCIHVLTCDFLFCNYKSSCNHFQVQHVIWCNLNQCSQVICTQIWLTINYLLSLWSEGFIFVCLFILNPNSDKIAWLRKSTFYPMLLGQLGIYRKEDKWTLSLCHLEKFKS